MHCPLPYLGMLHLWGSNHPSYSLDENPDPRLLLRTSTRSTLSEFSTPTPFTAAAALPKTNEVA
jgi:hypothetical protein